MRIQFTRSSRSSRLANCSDPLALIRRSPSDNSRQDFTKEIRVGCTRTERDLTGCEFAGTNLHVRKPATLSRRTSGYG